MPIPPSQLACCCAYETPQVCGAQAILAACDRKRSKDDKRFGPVASVVNIRTASNSPPTLGFPNVMVMVPTFAVPLALMLHALVHGASGEEAPHPSCCLPPLTLAAFNNATRGGHSM